MKFPSSLRRLVTLVLVLALVAPRALATWSIVVVDRATGEVCVASATCLGGKFDLKDNLAVVVVGEGAAAAQSAIDINGLNRSIIWNAIQAGETPARILDLLEKAGHSHQSRQYGIASFDGPPVTFTGTGAGEAKFGVVGEDGSLWYAIQGNVLAGDAVVTAAEQALLTAPGDLGQRVMAGMEAARAMGGDGRCSCGSPPDGCGAPPPNFTKSAHTAFIALARHGDEGGVCNGNDGCANGDFYVSIEFKGKDSDPDPVIKLQEKYDAWRVKMAGRPDHILSEVDPDRTQLVADGRSTAWVHLRLVDLEGAPLTQGGDRIIVQPALPGPPTAVPGDVVDHGDGTYSIPMIATDQPGRGLWNIRVRYTPLKFAQLYPPLALVTSALSELHAGRTVVSVTEDEAVPFTLNRTPADAGRPYRILGTAAGTQPGFDYQGAHVPLNRDPFFQFTWTTGGGPPFDGSVGVLDADGRAEAWLDVDPVAWAGLVGERMHFAALIGGGATEVTNLVAFEVVP